jgi:hypothetical protein
MQLLKAPGFQPVSAVLVSQKITFSNGATCTAYSEEEAGRIMSFMQHQKKDAAGAWRRAITTAMHLRHDAETGSFTTTASKHGSFYQQANERFR